MISISFSPGWDTLAAEIASDVVGYVNRSLDKAGAGIAKSMRENFAAEGSARGDEWEPTTQIAAAARKNPPSPVQRMAGLYMTLVDTGALRDSIDGSVVRGNQGYVLVIGSDRDYAPLMQFGGLATIDSVLVVVPARPFVNLIDNDIAALEAAFQAEPL